MLTATSGSVLAAVVSVSLCYESLKWLLNQWFATPFFCKLVWDVLFNACDDALFESGPKFIDTSCQSHVLDTVMDRNHVVVAAARLHQSALLKRDIFLLTWLIRGMFTSREASTTSWSEIPGLTTFLQEDGLFVIRRSSVLSSLDLW